LAGDSDEALSSPSYATAVGLLMEGLTKEVKIEETEEVKEEFIIESENEEETIELETKVEIKPKQKKKSFFEKFTEGLKDFLDNAE
jgi:cell division protein FtsA